MRQLRILKRLIATSFWAGLIFLLTFNLCSATLKNKQKKTGSSHIMTVVELQSELMGFADRIQSILFQAFENFDASNPDIKSRNFFLGDLTYTMSAAFTIAGQPDPEMALLDMIVIVSLGRSIYENVHYQTFGKSVTPIVNSFQELENDVWRIAAKVLDIEQQKELRELISQWHGEHSHQTAYSYIRFGDFAKYRGRTTLKPKGKKGGMFKSVQEATQQVEETRMLAERGLYLGSRLSLLTGAFAEYWLSQLLLNPQMSEILSDLNRVSVVSERLATVAEEIPQQIAEERQTIIKQASKEMAILRQATIDQVVKEANTWTDKTIDQVMDKVAVQREATINQFMNRLAVERQNAFQELLAEEKKVKGLVTEVRQTLSEGNNLLEAATTLVEKTGMDQPADEPFDIQDYRDAIADASKATNELSVLVDKINILIDSDGMQQLLPQITSVITTVGDKGEQMVDHTFRQAILLILIWLTGYIIVRLVLLRVSKKDNGLSKTN